MHATDDQGDRGEPSGEGSRPIRLAGSTLSNRAHICAFFKSPEEAYRVLLPFIKEGLDAGEKAVHTVDPRRRDEHIRWLASAGIDIPTVQRNEQFELRDWADIHLRGGQFDQHKTLALFEKIVKDAKEKGFRVIRFVTQMEWALETKLDLNDLLECEAKANDVWLRQEGPVSPVICTYDLRRFRGDIVVDVMRTHPLIIIGEVLQENPFFVSPDKSLEQLRQRGLTRANTGAALARVETSMQETVDEVQHLKACINNLVSILALPAIWTGGRSNEIATALLDVLLGMLRLDFVYVTLQGAADSAPFEMIRSTQSEDSADQLALIKETLEASLTCEAQTWPLVVQKSTGKGEVSIAAYRLGLNAEMGVLGAASRRTGFPDPNERILLNVAANQAAIGLQEARLLGDQRQRLSRATQVAAAGELAAAIAHEINQPLASLVANAHAGIRWLSAEPPNLVRAREAIERIVQDGNDAAEVAQRTRALFAGAKPKMMPLDVNELIGEILRFAQVEASRKGITIESSLEQGLPQVLGDRLQVQQVLLNLMVNGIEAMDCVTDRPKQLLIRTAMHSPDAVRLEVRDNGVGLQDPDKAFEPFFTTKEAGMGMGLAICRTIVEAHEGQVWAKANDDFGTTFCFTLSLGSASMQ